MSEELQGWHPDPFGRHEWRYFSAGRATFLVRDGRVEGSDPVEDISPQALPPSVVAGRTDQAPALAPAMPPIQPMPEIAAPVSDPERVFAQGAPGYSAPGYSASGHGASRRRRPGHSSRTAVLAAIAVVLVVVVVAVAGSSHHQRSAAGSSSITSPTAASSPSPAATYSAAAVGVMVSSTGGHFTARFPSEPMQQSFEETIAGVHASILVAAVNSPLTEVAEEDLSSAVSRSQQALALRSAIAVAAATVADGASTRQSDTTFRGKAARTSTFATSTGQQITAIAFFQDDRTVYFLIAEAGAAFQALGESLQFGSPSSPSVLS